MRLKVTKSKNAASLYVIKSVYNPKTQSNSSKIVEKLGTEKELREKLGGQDPYEWAKDYIKKLNQEEAENKREVLAKFSPVKQLVKGEQHLSKGGYLFLQDLYYELKLDKICKSISEKHKFKYDLNEILSYLVYGRILYPCSKKSTFEVVQDFIEPPKFEMHQIYRALEVLAQESDFIQAELYKNSMKAISRNTKVLYYDCTNYFFEIEDAKGMKQYGLSKENRPNPIVQMGLFMDGNGIPLAFCLNPGNQNEQGSLKPLEKKILADFDLSQFIVCTDAGLASQANRKFNDIGNRSFITTQSIKKLKGFLKEWALDKEGWLLPGKEEVFSLDSLDETKDKDKIYYKERWIKEGGLEQKLIVTFSLKHKNYQRHVRNEQIKRAEKLILSSPKSITKKRQTDHKRFIVENHITKEGEAAEKSLFALNEELIAKEESFDGFYAVCTNLEDETEEVIRINKQRWEIEESFRIMKSEFKSRPVYLSRDDRISAHFNTCFISLLIYRILEKRLGESFTCETILDTLRTMLFMPLKDEGYLPAYTRTDVTDSLHECFGFRTDYQVVTTKKMKKILKDTKSSKKVRVF